MAKIGVSIKLDVTKIDKARLFQGQKGTYLDLTAFIDLDQQDQYENNGFISQSVSKEERQQNVQTPILGNTKIFFDDRQSQAPQQQAPQPQYQQQAPQRQAPPASQQMGAHQQAPIPQQAPVDDFDDDIPF